MPTLASMTIPAPKSWEEFEEITLSCFQIKWESPNLVRHGRRGQTQHGVDIYGPDSLERFVGIQCKNTDNLTLVQAEAEILKAEKFSPPISAFYFATTAPSDTKMQMELRKLSAKRVEQKKFPVGIFYWEDLSRELVKNPTEFSKHYPQIKLLEKPAEQNSLRLRAILEFSYRGVALQKLMNLLFGEWSGAGGDSPLKDSLYLFSSIKRSAVLIFEETEASKVHELCSQTAAYIEEYWEKGQMPEGWKPVYLWVEKIESYVSGADLLFKGIEASTYFLGRSLGLWYTNDQDDQTLSDSDRNFFHMHFTALGANAEDFNNINNLYSKYLDKDRLDAGRTPHALYALARHIIIRNELASFQKD